MKLIVIDTNVIGKFNPDTGVDVPTGYNKFKKNDCNISYNINPKTYYTDFMNMLRSNNKDVDLILIAGHEPLFVNKPKINKIKTSFMYFLKNFMRQIENFIIPIIYLCADTHVFMDSTIKMGNTEVRQIIAGTGGATPDPFNDEYVNKILHKIQYIQDVPDVSVVFGVPVVPDVPDVPIEFIVNKVQNSYGFGSIDLKIYIESKGMGIEYHHKESNNYNVNCFKDMEPLSKETDKSQETKESKESKETGESIISLDGGNIILYKKCKSDYLIMKNKI